MRTDYGSKVNSAVGGISSGLLGLGVGARCDPAPYLPAEALRHKLLCKEVISPPALSLPNHIPRVAGPACRDRWADRLAC